jgi:FtsP/CotA-like multicopper oxidase with cupredoxin domain
LAWLDASLAGGRRAGVSGPPIPPGASGEYNFPLRFGGTFWMHSHQGLQEQELLAAPLIIRDGRDRPDQQEVVIMLADFSFTPPEQIYEGLRKRSGTPGMTPATPSEEAISGMESPPAKTMSAKPRMAGMAKGGASTAPDLNDVKYDAFLANDRTLADPEVIRRSGSATRRWSELDPALARCPSQHRPG